ncbi:PorV/PorQ family protein [Rhodocaloribacter litoris]|uniref:PorV/PorQ family protein n=1 Tax=Rhodocaloribacter litoris TaxID=2558931 RepID=UPI00142384EA|nr:PorV/PorQ family protein [Rhodocaloribacter litoris]QXD15752.1 PorV/PorQ family protein [Rhodocaloribacter litoris]
MNAFSTRHRVRRSRFAAAGLLVLLWLVPEAPAQKIAKYGADFLAGGVGARALGMGGAYVAVAGDVTAGYWNPAGLSRLAAPELAYMHAERFAGVVSFDYGSIAFPVNDRSYVGLSFFRSGVNDIKNTLDAWDPERDQPRPNPDQYFTSFSAADLAFFLSYARALGERFSFGVTGKVIRRNIGDFASAWGYSFDAGLQYRGERFVFGVNVQDLSTMLQSWSVNRDALRNIEEVFGDAIPEGGTELVLPVARLGTGVIVPVGLESSFTLGLDVDLAFDGQQAFVLNAGDVSFHPRLGTEFLYKGVLAFRAGVNRVFFDEGVSLTPSVGTGLHIRQLSIDYGFGDFAGLSSDLGFSHRISLQLRLERPESSSE